MIPAREFIIGYARVSDDDQNLERQLDTFARMGITAVFCEKKSGKRGSTRPELQKAIAALPRGGVLQVTDLSRLSRSILDIWRIISSVHERGATLRSVNEPWIDISTPHGQVAATFVGWAAENERAQILERTAAGRRRAQLNGKTMGRPRKLNDFQKAEALRLYRDENWSSQDIASLMTVSRPTIARYLRSLPPEMLERSDKDAATAA